METYQFILLFVGGILAGIINTLAGNGSAITLSLLMMFGFPANVANATNRIGALVQISTAVTSLRRTPRTMYLFKSAKWFLIPSLLGSAIGAFVAIELNTSVLKIIIGVFMLFLLATMLYSPKKWARATEVNTSRKTILNWILIFLIALYGGFIQMGIGIMLLSVLVLLVQYSLRDANIIKLVLAWLFAVPAFFVFLYSGDMAWIPGLVLAGGQAIGAVISARYILFLPKANLYVKWLLVVILSVSAAKLLGFIDFVVSLF